MNAPATLDPPERRTAPAPPVATPAPRRSVPAAVLPKSESTTSGTIAASPGPTAGQFPRPISLAEYHAMRDAGALPNDGQRIELLDGFLSEKPVPEPLHSGTVSRIDKRLRRALPDGWEVRLQDAITLPANEPLPDLVVVPEDDQEWFARHPSAEECAVVIEVSYSTLHVDRTRKLRIYAAAGVTPYWIVNLIDRRVEVHDEPSPGDGTEERPPSYRRRDVSPGETLSFRCGEMTIEFDAAELLPPVESAGDAGGRGSVPDA